MLKAKWFYRLFAMVSLCMIGLIYLKDYRERMLVRSILTPIEDAVGLSHPKVYSRNHFHHKVYDVSYPTTDPNIMGGSLDRVLVQFQYNDEENLHIEAFLHSQKGQMSISFTGDARLPGMSNDDVLIERGVVHINVDRMTGHTDDFYGSAVFEFNQIADNRYRFFADHLVMQTSEHHGHSFAESDDDLYYGEFTLKPFKIEHFSMSVPEVKSLWRSKQGSEHMLINVDSLSLPQLLHTPLLADAFDLYMAS